MADIQLTAADDLYVEPAADRNEWRNYHGLAGNDTLKLYSGNVFGDAGNDRIEKLPEAQWWHMVIAAYWDAPKAVRVDLAAGTAQDGWGGVDTLAGVDGAAGSAYDDVLVGNANDNELWAAGGNDSVFGGAGTDRVGISWFEPAPGQPWRQTLLADLDIQVSVDGRTAVIKPRSGQGFNVSVTDVEQVRVPVANADDWHNIALADYIRPQDMAQQAIAAGGELRWNAGKDVGSAVNLSFSFVTQAPAGGPGAAGFRAFTAAEQQVVRDILSRTAALSGLSFTEVTEAGANVGQLRFGVSQQAGTKGLSFLPGVGGDQAGDVWMDVDSMARLAPGSEGYAALLHEIGHALGLRHPRNVDAGDAWAVQLREVDDRSALTVMSEAASADGLWRSEWGSLDVLALRWLYGTKAANGGNTVYTLGSREANAQTTVNDDGGTDTLDASASAVGVDLDLTPGHLGSFGLSAAGVAGFENLSLLSTTWIENAVGSALDDVLLGNALDNRLTGGLGNDWLDGDEGTDTAVFAGRRTDYELGNSYGKVSVKARDGLSGLDTLVHIERLQFADQTVVLSPKVLAADVRFTVDEDALLGASLPVPTDVSTGLRYSLIGNALHGTASVSAQGQLSYSPAANYYGADSVTFEIAGPGGSNRYVAYVGVLPVNDDAPTGRDGDYLAMSGVRAQLRLPAASDFDNDTIAYSLAGDAARGVASVAATGAFTYEAPASFGGSDSFTYAVSDGMGGSRSYTARITVAPVAQVRTGSDLADTLAGSASGDGYVLLGGNDSVTGGGGDDVVDGGAGIDTAVYGGARANYTVAKGAGFWAVNDVRGADGLDRLAAVERLQFADRLVALDFDGAAGQTAQIIRALFGAGALKSTLYAGHGVTLLDQGMSYPSLVGLAIGTDAFLSLAHSRSNADFVKLVYQNVVGAAPAAADLAYYVGLLDSGAHTQQSLGVMACQIGLNAQSVELAGLASTGLDYIIPSG